jgi:DNA-binding MarR family transcriptional regulator
MTKKKGEQFFKVPGDKKNNDILGPNEADVYQALIRNNNAAGMCAPPISKIQKMTNLSAPTVKKNIDILAEKGYINIIPQQGKPNRYVFLKQNMSFEKFSPEFLDNKEIGDDVRRYWLVAQQFTKQSDDNSSRVMGYSARELSKMTGMSRNAINKCERSMLDLGFMNIEDNGDKTFDVIKYGQAVALILTKHEREIKELQQQVDGIEDRVIKRVVEEMTKHQNERIKELEAENKMLKNKAKKQAAEDKKRKEQEPIEDFKKNGGLQL